MRGEVFKISQGAHKQIVALPSSSMLKMNYD